MPKKILHEKHYHENKYKIVFFANRAPGIGSGEAELADIKRKVEEVVEKIGVPVQAFVAPTKTVCGKPAWSGMWDALASRNDGIKVDREYSFYVGEDRSLALDIRLPFFTREEHFLGAGKVFATLDPTIQQCLLT